jgi:hypothetical protein
VPVRFADDEIKAMIRASRATDQSLSEWLRDIARFGTVFQPFAPAGSKGVVTIPQCPECRKLSSKSLTQAICESCRKQLEYHKS